MIIVGEKINGAIAKTAEAIRSRDGAYIEGLAKAQETGGADYLDVCAGTIPEEEYDALCWLIDVVQGCSEKPICIDSPDPRILERVFPRLNRPGIINSISGEGEKCEILLPILRDNPGWLVIALCCDGGGVASAAEDKMRIAFELIERAGAHGVSPERIHIDPLVLALSASNDSAVSFCTAMKGIKDKYPSVSITAALSNVSFGMPLRRLVNRHFLSMALLSGLDSGILDPTNKDIIETIYATEALLGRDRHCRKFNNAYRSGKIGPVKT